MNVMIVVNQPSDWRFAIPDVEVVPARRYLTDPCFSRLRGVELFNLCRSYLYQSMGITFHSCPRRADFTLNTTCSYRTCVRFPWREAAAGTA